MLVTDSISFKSKNYKIRKADDIARAVSKRFPMVSSSKLSSLPKAELFADAMDRLHDKLVTTRINGIKALNIFPLDVSPKDKILNFLKIMKNDKLGNCSEMTDLAMIFTYLKNIKDTCVADIKNTADEHLNHVVLYVENGKKPYVIDPWLGFADYLPNAIQRYKSEFCYIFPFEKAKSQKFMFNKYNYTCDARKALDKCTYEELHEIKKQIR